MKMRVLGCDGGHNADANATALLFNDSILVDAGTVMTALTLEEALKISHLFLTHNHLDHIADLPFYLDATFNNGIKPLTIYGSTITLGGIRTHMFNNMIWPDFANLPGCAPQYTMVPLTSRQTVKVKGLKFTPIPVNHLIPTFAYLVEDKDSAVLFSSDTGPTDLIWDIANNTPNLKAVIVDLAFPNNLQSIADLSGHHTTSTLKEDLKKLKVECDVYAFHFKIGRMDDIMEEMADLEHMGKPIRALRDFKELKF